MFKSVIKPDAALIKNERADQNVYSKRYSKKLKSNFFENSSFEFTTSTKLK